MGGLRKAPCPSICPPPPLLPSTTRNLYMPGKFFVSNSHEALPLQLSQLLRVRLWNMVHRDVFVLTTMSVRNHDGNRNFHSKNRSNNYKLVQCANSSYLFEVFFPLATDVQYCMSNPCEKGGTCNDVLDGYTCSCVSGWHGVHCEGEKIFVTFYHPDPSLSPMFLNILNVEEACC